MHDQRDGRPAPPRPRPTTRTTSAAVTSPHDRPRAARRRRGEGLRHGARVGAPVKSATAAEPAGRPSATPVPGAAATLNSSICSRASKTASMRRRLCSAAVDAWRERDHVAAHLLVDQLAGGAELAGSARRGRPRRGPSARGRRRRGDDAWPGSSATSRGRAGPGRTRGDGGRARPRRRHGRGRPSRAGRASRGERVGLLLGEVVEVGRGGHARAERAQPGRDRDHLASPAAGVLVAGEGTGAADVALAGACGVRRRLDREPLACGPGSR